MTLETLAVIFLITAIAILFSPLAGIYFWFALLSATIAHFAAEALLGLSVTWQVAIGLIWLATLILITGLKKKPVWAFTVMIVMVIAITAVIFKTPIAENPVADKAPVSESTQVETKTWKMAAGDYGNFRWFADGISEIKTAKTNEEAEAAAFIWIDKVKRDPNLLVGAAKILLDQDVTKESLVDKNGNATDKAVQLAAQIELLLGQAKITPANAPANGVNTGVDDDQKVVAAAHSVIKGEKKSVKVVLEDGTVIYILARCGNIATPTKPNIPTGPTDDGIRIIDIRTNDVPIVEEEEVVVEEEEEEVLEPKDPDLDPSVQVKRDLDGEGLNRDDSEGDYIRPSEMDDPPRKRRVDPDPPNEEEIAEEEPEGSTEDNTPPPEDEEDAPTEDEPADEYSAPPGM